MATVAILGGSGMLGGMLVEHFARGGKHELIATVRQESQRERLRRAFPSVRWELFAPSGAEPGLDAPAFAGCGWIINAIGVIKPLIKDGDPEQVERAVRVNALLPFRLAELAASTGARVLQIATDCVYSGATGKYRESSPHDATDVYGKTKSLGECGLPAVSHLRCSIIGPEHGRSLSLLEWFLGQPRGARVNGFCNHLWNGVTTLHFARLCAGVIDHGLELPHLQHVVPGDCTTKAQMLEAFARAYGRADITVQATDAAVAVDRTLATEHGELNRSLWRAAGYEAPPTVARMIEELAAFPLQAAHRGGP